MQSRVGVLLLGLLLAVPGHLLAQETTGTVTGRVTDGQGLAIPGATVTVTGDQGTKTAVTDNEGRFNVPFLTPGDYTVQAQLTGFKTVQQKNVTVRLGQTVELPLTMQVGGVTETVEVSASSPVVDQTTTTAGATLDSEMLQRVPVGRRFSDTLYVAPGVVSSGSLGRANPSVSGASGLENQYVVDGVNITNAGYGALGSYSIYHGSLGNGVPYDFMQEIQVKTAGYDAEWGQSTGGVVNVVTKSGSNNLRGAVFGYSAPSGTEAAYKQLQTVNGAVNTTATTQSDVGASIGGPVLKDKVFFFGAIDPRWESRTLIAPDGFPLQSLGEIDRNRHITSYAGKGTWQVSPSHKLSVSVFGDPAHGDMGPQRVASLLRTDTAGFSSLDYGGHNQTVRYDGIMSPRWLIEASVSRAKNTLSEMPSVDQWSIVDRTVVPNVRSGGIGFYEVGNDGTNWQFAAKSTHLLGAHTVKYGGEYEDIDYANTIQRTGPAFTLPNGVQTVTGAQIDVLSDPNVGQFYRVARANTSNVRDTHQKYFDAFAQDTWRTTDRLTVRAGIRYEQQKLAGTIINDFSLTNNWAPRIGATYDVVGNGKSKLYANWGRFFAKIPNDLAARALSSDAGISRADYFDANLTQPIPEGMDVGGVTTHFIQQGVGADVIDPNVKSTYLDEFSGGFEYELLPEMNVGVRYIRRRFGRVLEDISPYSIVACDIGVAAACSVDYTLTNPGASTAVVQVPELAPAHFENPEHHYDALEITANKRFSRNWSLQASYSWSRLFGTFEGFYRNDNGQSDPGITSLYDFPTDDPNYTTIGVPQFGYSGDIRYLGALGAGPLPLDRPHVGKVYGNYTTNWGLNVGVGVQVNSGTPLTALAANPSYQNGGEIPTGPRGSGFETVDGFKTRTPVETDVSVHGGYSVGMRGTQRLVFTADVFNIFNNRQATGYDNFVESSFQALNPDFGQPILAGGVTPLYKDPLQVRFGVRYEF